MKEDADSESNTENDSEANKTRGSNSIGFGKITDGTWGEAIADCHHQDCKCKLFRGFREGGRKCERCGHRFEEHN